MDNDRDTGLRWFEKKTGNQSEYELMGFKWMKWDDHGYPIPSGVIKHSLIAMGNH